MHSHNEDYSLTLILTLGSRRSPPPVLPRVCVGLSTLPKHLGKVNISWDLLPCHLQNGADITSYIIRYTCLSTGVTTRISSSSRNVECNPEFGGLYSCVVANSLIPNDQAFSIQVAAQNNNGEGSFSDPINISTPVSSRYLTCSCLIKLHNMAIMFIAHTFNYFQIQLALVHQKQMMVVLLVPPQYLQMPHQFQMVVL